MTSTFSRLTYAVVMLRKQLAEQGRLAILSAIAFALFVFAIFFAKGGKAPGLTVSPVILGTILAFASGAAWDTLRRQAWFFLFLAFLGLWLGLGAIFGGTTYQASDFLNIALLGGFFLFVDQVSRVLQIRQILWTIAAIGAASAFFSMVVHGLKAPHFLDRMIPLGRGGNSIPGAGALAIALIAALALWRERQVRHFSEWAIPAALATLLVVALLLTQSRAPLIAIGVALGLAVLLHRRGLYAVLASCAFAWLLVAGLNFFEQPIKELICGSNNTGALCRPSYRHEVWDWVSAQIGLHPILGNGPSFRFKQQWLSHAHNGLLGTAMYYGLPVLAAFGAVIVAYARRLTRQTGDDLQFFGFASLVFSFGYMGADLSNPFAYFNTHYLFMWFPLFLVLACDGCSSKAGEGSAFPAANPDGSRHP